MIPNKTTEEFSSFKDSGKNGNLDGITITEYFNEGILDTNLNTYFYAHKVIWDLSEGLFKMWGCGGVSGDYIIYKEASKFEDLNNSSDSWTHALSPSWVDGSFDKHHTCDPSVIKYGNHYYLYYTGWNQDGGISVIGAAISSDGGRTFQRLYNGEPLIEMTRPCPCIKNGMPACYGAGQQAVIQGPDEYFYMIYSDIIECDQNKCDSFDENHPDCPAMSSVIHILKSISPSFPIELRKEIILYPAYMFCGVSLDFSFNRSRNEFIIAANGSPEDNDLSKVILIHLDRNLNIKKQTNYANQVGFSFGEGIALITNTNGDIVPFYDPSSNERHLNFISSTFGPDRGWHTNAITGPTRFMRYKESVHGILTDFSIPGDSAFDGDLDGDGLLDRIVLQPTSFLWRYQLSSENFETIHEVQHGQASQNDIAKVLDFDHDGRDDLIVWRPASGNWIGKISGSGNVETIQWGLPGDIPIPGDYNGDGKTDLAVWRPPEGNWYIRYSSGNHEIIQHGLNGDCPLVEDTDGNGNADLIVWRPGNSTHHVKLR